MIFNSLKKTIKFFLLPFPIVLDLYSNYKNLNILRKEIFFQNKLGFRFKGFEKMEKGNFEKFELKIFKKLLNNSSLFINVGANTGYYVCHALLMDKKVIAFEPDYTNQQILLQNVHANKWGDNFTFYPLALSNKVGIKKIYGGGTGASLIKGWSNQLKFNLTAVNYLDNFITNVSKEKIIIMIDIEGFEYECIRGSEKLLKLKNKPFWFVEICYEQHQPKGLEFNPNFYKTFKIFEDFGYKAIGIGKKLKLINFKEIKKIENTKVNNLDFYNFLFVDKKLKINEI